MSLPPPQKSKYFFSQGSKFFVKKFELDQNFFHMGFWIYFFFFGGGGNDFDNYGNNIERFQL